MAPSTFSWLDYSEKDRQRAQTVIDSLREHDTQDEIEMDVLNRREQKRRPRSNGPGLDV